jgi:GGDEF domain-containing protein
MQVSKWFWIGSRQPLLQQLVALLGRAPAAEPVSQAKAGDLVVVDAQAGAAASALPHGHVFAGVRALKDVRGLAVHVVVDADDRFGPELARFCLADGVLRWDGSANVLDASAVDLDQGTPSGKVRGPAVDQLLKRVQDHLAKSGRADSTLQRLLQFEREDTLLHSLQDAETGLFDGPYATLKLDEEWKRAMRFHQPLSLLLVDLGPGVQQVADARRRELLAEAAGVFLNECRDIDVLARFAPTVFLLLLPGTGPAGAEVLAGRILAALRQRLQGVPGLLPACGSCSVPATEIPDRKAFLAVTEACLRRAQASGAGGLCTTWQ